MFEQINYSFSLATIKIIIAYFVYINFGFFLLGAVGLFMEKVTKIRIPSVGKILVGYAIYSTLAWWLFKAGHTIIIVPTLITFSLFMPGYVFVAMRQKKLSHEDLFLILNSYIKKVGPIFVLQLVLISFWAGFLTNKSYHILTYGNNDVYFWGLMSDHVMGISNLQRINFGEGGNQLLWQTIDCFGVYSWMGLMGKIAMKSHSIEAAMLFQLTLLILSAWLIYEISWEVIGVTMPAAFISALVFSFNSLWVYIFTNNFLSQMTATFCFFGCIFIIGASVGATPRKRHGIFFGFILYLCFVFSYPGLLLPYIAFVVSSICVFNYLVSRARNCTPWKEMGTTIICVFAGIFLGAITLYDVTFHAINRFVVLSKITAGWSLSMIDPLNLIGLISYSIDKTIFSIWPAYLLLTIVLCILFFMRYFNSKKQSINEAKYNSLLLLAIIALISYLCAYYIKGDGYQQWKFATYFPLPLLILVVVNYFAPKRHV